MNMYFIGLIRLWVFIEIDTPLEKAELFERLQELEKACETGNDELVREVLKKAVPTYKSPNDINAKANAVGDNLKYLHPIMTILQHSTKKVD